MTARENAHVGSMMKTTKKIAKENAREDDVTRSGNIKEKKRRGGC